MEHIYVSSSRK